LGQNFLIDKNIIDKITTTVSIANNEVLEVGPGTGNLTKEILKNNPSKLYLVEKDTFLAENLEDIIDERVKIFNKDILNLMKIYCPKKKL
jgi:16S rRNA (adenine1518-N6/adenine1519-N6)-dimethyltransferase